MPFSLTRRKKDGTIEKHTISIAEALWVTRPKVKTITPTVTTTDGPKTTKSFTTTTTTWFKPSITAPNRLPSSSTNNNNNKDKNGKKNGNRNGNGNEKGNVNDKKALEEEAAVAVAKQPATFTEAETTQLRELKTSKPPKPWKEIAGTMGRDIDDLRAHWKEINNKDANTLTTNGADSGGGGAGGGAVTDTNAAGATATAAATGINDEWPPKNSNSNNKTTITTISNKQDQQPNPKVNNPFNPSQTRLHIASEKRAAGLKRAAEKRAQREAAAAAAATANPTTTSTNNNTAPVPAVGGQNPQPAPPVTTTTTITGNHLDAEIEAKIHEYSAKLGRGTENYLGIASRVYDETGKRVGEEEIRRVLE